MHEEIIISGFGGQGVLFAGQILAQAAVIEGRHVTWIPSYGPEMRGGTAHVTVIISDEEIGSPLVRNPSVVIALNPPSMTKYAPLVRAGGLLILDSSLVDARAGRKDIREIPVPAKDIAADLGFEKIANVVTVGALVAATDVLSLDSVEEALEEKISARHRDALEANKMALRKGAELVEGLVPA